MVDVDIFRSRKPRIGPLTLDCSLSEEHASESELTDRPIETGGIVTDHVVQVPRALLLTVGISSLPDELLSVPEPTRHLRVWRELRDMQQRFELLDVVTTLEIYPLMMITSLRTVRTRESTGALQIAVRLRQVEFAAVDSAHAIADAAQDIALGEADIGAQAAEAAAAAELVALGVLVGVREVSERLPPFL